MNEMMMGMLVIGALLVLTLRRTEPAPVQESTTKRIRKVKPQATEEAYSSGAFYGFKTLLELVHQGWRVRETVNGGFVALRGDEMVEIYWSEHDQRIKMAAMFEPSQSSRNGNGHKHIAAADINRAFENAVIDEQYTN